jgi:hypothetical protein
MYVCAYVCMYVGMYVFNLFTYEYMGVYHATYRSLQNHSSGSSIDFEL